MKEPKPMNVGLYESNIQELISNCSISEAFAKLKNQLIRIDYKFVHFNLIEDGLHSLKVIGDIWVKLFNTSTFEGDITKSQEYFRLLVDLLMQILEGVSRSSNMTDGYKKLLVSLKVPYYCIIIISLKVFDS